jgi:hypothetical protein
MSKTSLIIIVILLGMVAYGGYYLGNKNQTAVVPVNTQPVATTTVTTTITPTVDDTAIILSAVKQGLVAKHGSSANELKITVSKIQGNYAQGGASATGGGAMWFAVKENSIWKLVWDGNGTISCDLITQYPDFPKTMIPECWNEKTLKSVVR